MSDRRRRTGAVRSPADSRRGVRARRAARDLCESDDARLSTSANLSNILVQSSILLLLALPMTLIIMTEGLDLSTGAVLTLSSVVLALAALKTGSLPLAFAAAVAVGLAFGLLNGWIIADLDIPPFVATLGTLGIAQGLCLVLTDGQSVVGLPAEAALHLLGSSSSAFRSRW